MRVVPAREVPFEDLLDVLGRDPGKCACQRWKLGRWEWTPTPVEERQRAFEEQTHDPDSTTGVVAYDGDTAVGWCAVEPRTAYPLLLTNRSPVPWKGRDEDRDDDSVWAITCFVVRKGHRRQGIMAELVRGAVEHARASGARVVEGYPMVTEPGREIIWDELFVGAVSAFVDNGFTEVSAPTKRRRVLRLEL